MTMTDIGAIVEELDRLPVFDRETLQTRLGGEELIVRFVTLFAESCKGYLASLRDALTAGDAPSVKSQAHAIKGAAANIAANRMQYLAAAIELRGSAGELEGAGELLQRLEEGLIDFRRESGLES